MSGIGPKNLRKELDNVGISRQDLSLADSTTTALGIGAVYIGTPFSTNGYAKIVGSAYSDQASAVDGLEIQQSQDGVNWDVISAFTVSAGVGLAFSVEIVAPHARLRYTNGGTAQTVFRLYANLRVI